MYPNSSSEIDYKQYCDERIHQLRIVCKTQWDYLTVSDVEKWLEQNFNNDNEGKYYAIKILLHTIYYRKKDKEALLWHGVYDKLLGEIIKKELFEKENIYIQKCELEGKLDDLLSACFFIPLLDSDKPSESGNQIIGDLVHKIGVSEKQVGFIQNITSEEIKDTKYIVFVDDCIGTGNQLKKFWNSNKVEYIKKICTETNIKIFYLVLIGYDKNLTKLVDGGKLAGIEIIVCDILTDKNRVFSDESLVWDSIEEKQNALKYFDEVKNKKGVKFRGYKQLDFAVILHDRLPNWSLPIYWEKSANWEILLHRKNSEK